MSDLTNSFDVNVAIVIGVLAVLLIAIGIVAAVRAISGDHDVR